MPDMTTNMVKKPAAPKVKMSQVSAVYISRPPRAGMAMRVACQMKEFSATALNSPMELARLVVESVVKFLHGEQVDKNIHTPAVLITKDNVDQYYDPDALF